MAGKLRDACQQAQAAAGPVVVTELAAHHVYPFRHAEQASLACRASLVQSATVVFDAQPELFVIAMQTDRTLAGMAVAHDIGQCFLRDPVNHQGAGFTQGGQALRERDSKFDAEPLDLLAGEQFVQCVQQARSIQAVGAQGLQQSTQLAAAAAQFAPQFGRAFTQCFPVELVGMS